MEDDLRISHLDEKRKKLLLSKLDMRTDKIDTEYTDLTSTANTYKPLDFSLFFFSDLATSSNNKYDFLIEAAKFADSTGFKAIWLPERHFKSFGGLYPNPAILASALAMSTKNIHIRAGSVVAPLHDPIRIAEEWSVVDNLANGRCGIALANGWNVDDFALSPDNYAERWSITYETYHTLKTLWRGHEISRVNGHGKSINLNTYPQPLQADLPIWLTAGHSPQTFTSAGKIGSNLLSGLIEQNLEGFITNLTYYKNAIHQNNHDITKREVTLMLHTYIDADDGAAKSITTPALKGYLEKFVSASRDQLYANPTSSRIVQQLNDDDINAFYDHAVNRYLTRNSLIGSPQSCLPLLCQLSSLGVTEIACLLDFGLSHSQIFSGLKQLVTLKSEYEQLLVSKNHAL